jgi:ribosomal protein S18 acetylase RimI-like enzyme
VTVREFVRGDEAECVSLGLEAFGPVHSSMEQQYGSDLFDRLRPDWQSAQAEMIEFLCNAEDKRTFVAVRQDSVVGFIVATPDTATGLASVDIVAVHPNEQRSGIGSSLMRQSLDDLRQSGMVYVQAYLRDFPGHDPARHLFEKTGFSSMRMQPMPFYMPLTNSVLAVDRPTNIRPIAEADVAECVADDRVDHHPGQQ